MRTKLTLTAINLLVILLLFSCKREPQGILISDFERGETLEEIGWEWWSRHGGEAGSASFATDARKGRRSVKIEHDGEMLEFTDWTLTNQNRFNVNVGEEWTASAWVKYEDSDGVGIEIMGMCNGKEATELYEIHTLQRATPSRGLWASGWAIAYGTGDWELLEASAIIPPEIDQIYVRISGLGKTKAWIDHVQLRHGLAWRTSDPRPKVEGWNFTGTRLSDCSGRSVVAYPVGENQIYIRWRLLESDPEQVAFDVYRSKDGGEMIKMNDEPVRFTTDFVDSKADLKVKNEYMVRPVGSQDLSGPSNCFTVEAGTGIRSYFSIPLQDKDAMFGKVAVGDLNGDGRYDFVIKTPATSLDPVTWRPSEHTYKLEAYLADGTFLWSRDLGWNIEAGAWYSPYVVFDLDGDGKAEVAVKTAPMDVDYRDKEPSERLSTRYRYAPGRVNSGPEYLSILDGMSGEEITRTDWPSRDGLGRYNHNARHQMGVAYLDGKTPAILAARGTYTVMKLEAYHFHDKKLEQLWYWDSTHEPGGLYFSQGAHTMHAADIDEDGRDELILGSCVLDDNGDGLWTLGVYHPDNLYVSDIDPTRPGLEIYLGIEGSDAKGMFRDALRLVDAKTGEMLWGLDRPTHHIHGRGLVSNIDSRYVGMECYSGERNFPIRWLHSAKGELIADETVWTVGLSPCAVYWDSTPERAVVVDRRIVKFPGEMIADHLEGRLVASLDLFGDWREEIIISIPGELRIYMTDIPASDRRVSLMADPVYRNNVAHQSMGYNVVPLTSYYIGRK